MTPLTSSSGPAPNNAAISGRATPVTIVMMFALAAAATAASSWRIVIGPGFELYLAPLFYLLTYRIWGLRAGILAATVFMMPSWGWWGHPVSILLAIGHVVVVDRFVRRNRTMAEATGLFAITAGTVIGFGFLWLQYGAPPSLAGVVVIRKVINDTLFATIADMLALCFIVDPVTLAIRRRKTVSLSSAIYATSLLFGAAATTMLFVGEVRRFATSFESTRQDISRHVALLVTAQHHQPKTLWGMHDFVSENVSARLLVVPDRTKLPATDDLKRLLDCKNFDDRDQPAVNDQSTFAYWVTACHVRTITVPGTGMSATYASSLRPFALAAYTRLLTDLLGFSLVVAIGIAINLWLKRRLDRSLDAWDGMLSHFGEPDLQPREQMPFVEFQRPVSMFVEKNNSFTEALAERDAISKAIAKLKQSIDLILVADISYDVAAGVLRFVSLDRETGRQTITISVHDADQQSFTNVCAQSEAIVELRIKDRPPTDWFLAVLRDNQGYGRWSGGCFLRLRQAKVAEDMMMHQARLTDLGGMASALSHELRQPLFTIALAAENGLMQLEAHDHPAGPDIARKLRRIEEQVARARAIIDRISRYGRIDSGDGEPFELVEAVTAATNFMRPLLVAQDVRLRIGSALPVPVLAAMPRVALEQIIVNAIQNSLDAIASRREYGPARSSADRIDILVAEGDGGIDISVHDTGIGLGKDAAHSAFDPFFTTKAAGKGTGLGLYISRQIMLEVGGSLTIRDGERGGAVLTVRLPETILRRRKAAIGHAA
jgi:signal transduction histidine kinase